MPSIISPSRFENTKPELKVASQGEAQVPANAGADAHVSSVAIVPAASVVWMPRVEAVLVAPAHTGKIELSPLTFILVWFSFVGCLVVCASYLALWTALYWLLGTPWMVYYASFLRPAHIHHLWTFAGLYAVTAAALFSSVVHICHVSIQQRTLVLVSLADVATRVLINWASRASTHIAALSASRRRSVHHRVLQRVHGGVVVIQDALMLLLSVNSPYFFHIHVVREALEVAAQTYQAYSASYLIGSSLLNYTLVVLLVLNCWSTPAIHAVMACHKPINTSVVLRSKVLCMLMDVVFAVLSCVVVPMTVLIPYWKEFDIVRATFPPEKLHDDVFFSLLVTNLQMLVPATWPIVLLRLFPFWSTLSCLLTIQQIVVRDESADVFAHLQRPSVAPTPEHIPMHLVAVKPSKPVALELHSS